MCACVLCVHTHTHTHTLTDFVVREVQNLEVGADCGEGDVGIEVLQPVAAQVKGLQLGREREGEREREREREREGRGKRKSK